MKTRSLIRILLLLPAGWILLAFPVLLPQLSILQNAGGYRPAEFQVTGSRCIDTSQTADEGPAINCFLTGSVLIDGKSIPEEYAVGSALPTEHRPGSRFAVFYNPAMPGLVGSFSGVRILRSYGESDAAAAARRRLWAVASSLLFSLAAAIVIHIALRLSIRRLSKWPRTIAIDPGGGPASVGTVFCSFGLSLLIAQFPDFTQSVILFSLILLTTGIPMLIRPFLALSKDDGGRTRGYHFFGLAFWQQSQPLPKITWIGVEGSADSATIVMAGADGRETVRGGDSYAANLKVAAILAAFYGVPLRSDPPYRDSLMDRLERKGLALLRRSLILVIGLSLPLTMIVLAIGSVPAVRLSLAVSALDPFGTQRYTGFIRRWALDQLVNNVTPEAVLELLRQVNTVDAARFPEVATDIDAAAIRRSGLVPLPERDREANVRFINSWAASHLGKRLDENGGILSWVPVSERFVDPIDKMAGEDLNEACQVWYLFGAGVLNSQEQFIYAVGPALGDPRPIYFAIVKSGSRFEGQPVSIDTRPDALVRTAGEALALHLWLKIAGDSGFPKDFRSWWSRYAREHRLPPLSPQASPSR